MKKTLVITEWAPPVVEGGPVLLGRLLRRFPKGSYAFLCRRPEEHRSAVDPSGRLDCQYDFFHVPQFLGSGRVARNLNRVLTYLLIPMLTVRGLRLVRSGKFDNILSTTMGEGAIIAAYFVSLVTRRPLFVYCFDAWRELAVGRVDRVMAFLFERRVLSHAASVFVMSEALQGFYRQKYGLSTVMLPHPVDRSLYDANGKSPRPVGKECRIVFTGVIHSPQLDSVKRLAEVVNSLENAKLALYTPNSPHELAAAGVGGRNVEYGFVESTDVPRVQQEADVLFLPMAFNFPNPALIATASPSKMPEYLAAARPILVHAPSYSFIADYARKHGFGLVVDKPDEKELKAALLSLMNDQELRGSLAEKGRALAQHHDLESVSNRLKEFLLQGGPVR
ncbi:MAG: glycosyltransferase [Chloroflexi bacterium]|nr:glycosyltransferase [Chloroflexota bacterium]